MSNSSNLFIGMMSGTSLDGVDTVLVECSGNHFELLRTQHQPYPDTLKQQLESLLADGEQSLSANTSATADSLADFYADNALALIQDSGKEATDIRAIGNHGQTIWHAPPVSLQLDNAELIAQRTGITVINQFRQADLAAGGEGAPLVPAFHQQIFGSDSEDRVVVNIGGISNVTVLRQDGSVSGCDTGPGNTLLDGWVTANRGLPYDDNGQWAKEGSLNPALLSAMLDDPWLALTPPKSTGRELFNLEWLNRFLKDGFSEIQPADVQATLCELTAASIAKTLSQLQASSSVIAICGGGVHNSYLMNRLQAQLPDCSVKTTGAWGIEPDWVEACAFAWLAMARLNNIPGNHPAVTGASKACLLGEVHHP